MIQILKAIQGFLQTQQNYKKLGEVLGNGQCLLKVSSYAYSISHLPPFEVKSWICESKSLPFSLSLYHFGISLEFHQFQILT